MARSGLFVSLVVSCVASPTALAQPTAERSFERLITGNGHFVASYDRSSRRIDTFLEHPYRFATPRDDPPDLCRTADESRDLAFDAYFGVRGGGAGEWLGDAPLDEAGYLPGTNVIRAVQHTGPDRSLRAETWYFAPTELDEPALVMVAEIENVGASAIDTSVYALMNFHLGAASGGREPSADGEEASWDAARSALYEYGPSQGTIAYVALTPVARVSTATGSASAYERLQAGADIDDVRSTSAPENDLAPGLEAGEIALAPGERVSMAVAVVWALDEDAGPDVDAVRAWAAGRAPRALVDAEVASWDAWQTEPPAGVEGARRDLWRQAAAILRMGQVREAGPGRGQILASLPPGLGNPDAQWNIAWVRDMAYAVVGLARAGHLDEARAALEFELAAPRGRHEAEVGMPYRISVTRYFGDGQEDSDCNADGPNVEFDGFGLFLWSLGEYLRAGGDRAVLDAHWDVVSGEIADVLVSLVDDSGVIAPDSSIWEVHWNGKQRRFTYTSLAAVRGLCDAAELAELEGDADASGRYRATAEGIRNRASLATPRPPGRARTERGGSHRGAQLHRRRHRGGDRLGDRRPSGTHRAGDARRVARQPHGADRRRPDAQRRRRLVRLAGVGVRRPSARAGARGGGQGRTGTGHRELGRSAGARQRHAALGAPRRGDRRVRRLDPDGGVRRGRVPGRALRRRRRRARVRSVCGGARQPR